MYIYLYIYIYIYICPSSLALTESSYSPTREEITDLGQTMQCTRIKAQSPEGAIECTQGPDATRWRKSKGRGMEDNTPCMFHAALTPDEKRSRHVAFQKVLSQERILV